MGGQSTLASKLYDILYGAGYALDTPGAYMRGLMAGAPGERASGRDVIDSWGVMSPNRAGWHWDDLGDMAGDVGGFAIEAFLDPLNLIPIGWLGKVLRGAGKAADAVNVANHATMIADAAKAADYVRALEQHRISRGMGEIVDEALEGSGDALRRIEGVPLGYEPRGMIEHYPNGRNFAEDQLLENELLLKPYEPFGGPAPPPPEPWKRAYVDDLREALDRSGGMVEVGLTPNRPEFTHPADYAYVLGVTEPRAGGVSDAFRQVPDHLRSEYELPPAAGEYIDPRLIQIDIAHPKHGMGTFNGTVPERFMHPWSSASPERLAYFENYLQSSLGDTGRSMSMDIPMSAYLDNWKILMRNPEWVAHQKQMASPLGRINQTMMQPSQFGPLDIPPPRPEYGQLLPPPPGPSTTEAAIALAALFGQQALARSQNFLPVMNPLNQYPSLP